MIIRDLYYSTYMMAVMLEGPCCWGTVWNRITWRVKVMKLPSLHDDWLQDAKSRSNHTRTHINTWKSNDLLGLHIQYYLSTPPLAHSETESMVKYSIITLYSMSIGEGSLKYDSKPGDLTRAKSTSCLGLALLFVNNSQATFELEHFHNIFRQSKHILFSLA
jgi:hypothetical protein